MVTKKCSTCVHSTDPENTYYFPFHVVMNCMANGIKVDPLNGKCKGYRSCKEK